uniref:Cell adhesion molecule 4-like n=1 Tax=Geotrypetes seraphini TaxID=260995 RepID=A0A6P8NUF1_GEOSA|nr:cell adhesion molecule 4-like [Geotrypetes seraphini]
MCPCMQEIPLFLETSRGGGSEAGSCVICLHFTGFPFGISGLAGSLTTMDTRSVYLQLILACLLCSTALVCSKSCSLWLVPKHPVVPYGTDIVLNCSTSCTNYTSLDWETSVRKNLSRGVQWVALYISKQSAWTLTPQCYLIHSDGSPELSSVNILFYTFSSPEIHLRDEIVAGQEQKVTCDVSSMVAGATPSDIELTLSGAGTALAQNRNLLLEYVFTTGAKHDGMVLVCTALLQVANTILIKNKTVLMTVFYKPTNTSVLTERRVFQVGENFTVSCRSTGNPAPNFTWRLPSNESVEVASDGRMVSVYSATVVHSGDYECNANNRYGLGTARANIIVEQKNVPPWAIVLIVLFVLGGIAVAAFLIHRALL